MFYHLVVVVLASIFIRNQLCAKQYVIVYPVHGTQRCMKMIDRLSTAEGMGQYLY